MWPPLGYEVVKRWEKADFRHLKLAGFYYLTEQGAYEDEVLHAFPELCNEYRLRSFAIPGITSNWLTEFSRAGFDTVLLQSSHAFWQPALSPPRYLLKCAGQIARHYGMGMEVNFPICLEPAGRQNCGLPGDGGNTGLGRTFYGLFKATI